MPLAVRFALIFLSLIVFPLRAAPLPVGSSIETLDIDGVELEVFTYKPVKYAGGALLVSFHGLSRGNERYLAATREIADRHGLLVVLPHFDRGRFPYWRYQALGITRQSRRVTTGPIPVEPQSAWTTEIILKLIERVRANESLPNVDYYLLGHSAGGQVANRMAAFSRQRAKRIVVANPSSYVEPATSARFPYGFGDLPETIADNDAIRRYLAQPITIMLGTGDVLDKDLDKRPEAMRQGETRYERGSTIYAGAQALAKKNGWPFNWRRIEVPGVGHDVEGMYAPRDLEAALFRP
jgi:poly(3-hydroxybutyrate) depolymerase